jgi:hypothetical protein
VCTSPSPIVINNPELPPLRCMEFRVSNLTLMLNYSIFPVSVSVVLVQTCRYSDQLLFWLYSSLLPFGFFFAGQSSVGNFTYIFRFCCWRRPKGTPAGVPPNWCGLSGRRNSPVLEVQRSRSHASRLPQVRYVGLQVVGFCISSGCHARWYSSMAKPSLQFQRPHSPFSPQRFVLRGQ